MSMWSPRPFRLGRRALLRGASGAFASVIALPRLEAMLSEDGLAYADGVPLPKCFLLWFWGNGTDPKRWIPKTTGAGFELPEQLAALAPVKPYVSLVTNLKPRPPRGDWPHLTGQVGLLTGDDYKGTSFRDGTVNRPSLDQVIAKSIGVQSRFKSLEIRIGRIDSGQGTAQDEVSHNGPGNPNRGATDVKTVFERLFGTGFAAPTAGVAKDPMIDVRRSVLDVVLADAKSLNARLGSADRARLEQHLEAVRALESRLATTPPASATCGKPGLPVADTTMRSRNDAMAKLISLALACDMTRVVTYTFSSPASHSQYPEAGVKEDVHEYSHTHGVDPVVWKAITFWMECFGSFLATMKGTPDGAGNLLDRACVFGTSDMAYGPSHSLTDFPLVLVGRAAGALVHPGVHVRPAKEDTASMVPLTILRAMGVPATEWGVGGLRTDKVVSEVLG